MPRTRKAGVCDVEDHQLPPGALDEIDGSQADAENQRHKCAACAWNAGYEAGLREGNRLARAEIASREQ